MAKRAYLAVGLLVVALTGCQSNKPMVVNLPPPSFEGPRVLAKTTPTNPPAAPMAAAPSGPRDWRPAAPARAWKWIVVHHSAGPSGSMLVFDKEHKAKGWDGVGYHFVIGNGTNSADGQIEVTARWPAQKWGAHAKTLDNRYNEFGIGICMVGNFDVERPTAKQMQSLTRLMAYLMQTYHIPSDNIVGHRDTKPTECPGRFVNVPSLRQSVMKAIADAGGSSAPAQAQTAQAEIMLDLPQ